MLVEVIDILNILCMCMLPNFVIRIMININITSSNVRCHGRQMETSPTDSIIIQNSTKRATPCVKGLNSNKEGGGAF